MADDLSNKAEGTKAGGVSAGLVVGLVLGALLTLFVLQNTKKVEVTWLVFDAKAPLWIVLAITALSGVVIASVIGAATRRSRRKRE